MYIFFNFLEKEINVILNHGAEDAECYGECAARMLVTHQNEKPQLSISQVNKIIFIMLLCFDIYYIVFITIIPLKSIKNIDFIQERVSLPGTPMSTVSQRSSGESYTSVGSSRLLLAAYEKTTPV